MTQKHNRAAPDRPITPPNRAGTSHDIFSAGSPNIPIPPSVVQARLNAYEFSASYAATQNIIHRVEYQTGKAADVLVVKGGDSEFILRGVFQIARNDFHFTADGNFDPANSFSSRFQDMKLSCRLTAPSTPEFAFAQTDFDHCIENIRRLEKLIRVDNNDEVLSALSKHLGKTQFKLCHALFEPRPILTPEETDDNHNTTDSQNDDDTVTVASEEDIQNTLGPEFAMEAWPVSARCHPHLVKLFETHDICPLPAFDSKGKLIPPTHYESMLQGATVEVHFAFVHHYIKKSKKHIYLTRLRKLEVLRCPSTLPSSPFKPIRVRAVGTTNKGKTRA